MLNDKDEFEIINTQTHSRIIKGVSLSVIGGVSPHQLGGQRQTRAGLLAQLDLDRFGVLGRF